MATMKPCVFKPMYDNSGKIKEDMLLQQISIKYIPQW